LPDDRPAGTLCAIQPYVSSLWFVSRKLYPILTCQLRVHATFLHSSDERDTLQVRVHSRCLSSRVQFTRTLEADAYTDDGVTAGAKLRWEQLGTVIAPRRVLQWKRSISGVWDGQCTRIPAQTGKIEFQLCFDRDIARPRALRGMADLPRWPDL
jgi:hypothetical protein